MTEEKDSETIEVVIEGADVIATARHLVRSALGQPNIYPQIRSDLMAIGNRLDRSGGFATLTGEEPEILEAYCAIARRAVSARGERADEMRLAELARQLAHGDGTGR